MRAAKEWAKGGCLRLFLRVWKLLELQMAREYMPLSDGRKLSEQEVNERFTQVGGVPRAVFDDEDWKAFCVRQESQAGDEEMVRRILQGSLPHDVQTKGRIPTFLFAYNSETPFGLDNVKIELLSTRACEQLIMKQYDTLMGVCASISQAGNRGLRFEDLVGWLLARGACAFPNATLEQKEWNAIGRTRNDKWRDVDRFRLPPPQPLAERDEGMLMETWRLWKETDQGGLLRTPEGFPGIDFLLSASLGVNAASGSGHDEPTESFAKYLEVLDIDPTNFTIMYFVPERNFKGFQVIKHSKENRMTELPRLSKVSVPMRATFFQQQEEE